jgi:hypothetical protein
MFGSQLRRRFHSFVDGAIEYEKTVDEIFVWIWDWTNELLKGFFSVSAEVGLVKVYDLSALTYRDIIERAWGDFVEMAAWPSTTQDNDAIYFGNMSWPDEIVIEIDTPTTAGVYGGNAVTWEYYNGTAWVALTILGDTSDLTGTGARPFSQAGEITANKPAAMASVAVDGVTAEWIRCRVSTVANVTTVPIFAYTDVNEFVASVSYVDSGTTRTSERLDGDVSSCLVSGTGEFEATMTSNVGRKVQLVFRFVEPDMQREDDYGV